MNDLLFADDGYDHLVDVLSDADRAEAAAAEAMEGYCDLCEVTGHTFRTCPRRDDDGYDDAEGYG